MASSSNGANSRLKQLQMRFQQKQQQEREQKRQELTDTADDAAKLVGNGKVRQMFDERRRGAGIDRSNPLKPIADSNVKSTFSKSLHSLNHISTTSLPARATNTRKTPGQSITSTRHFTPVRNITHKSPTHTLTNGQGITTTRHFTPVRTSTNNNNKSPTHTLTNGNAQRKLLQSQPQLDELDNIAHETLPKGFSSLSLYERTNGGSPEPNGDDDNNNRNKMFNIKTTHNIKLNPVVTKKSPPVLANRITTNTTARKAAESNVRTPPSPKVTRTAGVTMRTTNGLAAKKAMSSAKTNTTTTAVKSGFKARTNALSNRNNQAPDGTTPCRICGRNFLTDRLEKHQLICQKMNTKQRKIFDASKHRVKGTDAEKYLKRGAARQTAPTVATGGYARTTMTPQAAAQKKNNWRQKHEDFIAAIRAAKQMQAHLAKGGKLSDLPPPPPSYNPDYIECPHCQRRFNESAAERHIPKCANMRHNKPKPGAQLAARKR